MCGGEKFSPKFSIENFFGVCRSPSTLLKVSVTSRQTGDTHNNVIYVEVILFSIWPTDT